MSKLTSRKKVYYRDSKGVFRAIPDVKLLIFNRQSGDELVKLYTLSRALHNKFGNQEIELK